jgi:hypothetical protein
MQKVAREIIEDIMSLKGKRIELVGGSKIHNSRTLDGTDVGRQRTKSGILDMFKLSCTMEM